jgi:hypothetical protein
MTLYRDNPKTIAGVLWALGAFGTIYLGISALTFPVAWGSGHHWMLGFAIWLGWLWRSQKLRPLAPAACVWIASIFVNGWWLLPQYPSDKWNVARWWWLFVTVASAAGLVLEILTSRDENAASSEAGTQER